PVPLPPVGAAGLQLLGGPPGQGAQHAGGEAGAGVAVAGGVGRAGLQAGRGAVGEDSGHGIPAATVLAGDLGEETRDGGDGIEQPVAIRDAVLVEGLEDAAFAQGVSEGQSLVARAARADLLQGGHRGTWDVSDGSGAGPGSAPARPSPTKGI